MKKTIILALLAISMAACTQTQPQPQRCELFGVSLGMSHEEVNAILVERFGKGETYGEGQSIMYEDIFHDGMKYTIADFCFTDGILSYVHAMCDKEVEFTDINKIDDDIINVWDNVHELDSILSQRHKIYHNPVSRGIEDGNVVTFATKDIRNMVDYISVRVSRHKWSYNNTESVSLILDLTELEKQL